MCSPGGAKWVTTLQPRPLQHLVSHVKNSMFRTNHMTLLKDRTKEKSWRNAILNLPDCPRGIAVAAFRLACKHDCLYAHLYRFELMDSPACPLCRSGATMDTDHLDCSALAKNCIFSLYWEDRDCLNSLTHWLFASLLLIFLMFLMFTLLLLF